MERRQQREYQRKLRQERKDRALLEQQPSECPDCEPPGSGEVDCVDILDSSITHRDQCPECGGTGKKPAPDDCECKGTGQVAKLPEHDGATGYFLPCPMCATRDELLRLVFPEPS